MAKQDKFTTEFLENKEILELLQNTSAAEIPSCMEDLRFLYNTVRTRKPYHILEFGSGFSTIVMAYACAKNWERYLEICKNSPRVSSPKITSVETIEKWKNNTSSKLRTSKLDDFATVCISSVHISEYNGEICHFYDTLPNIVPDMIYLDGPDPKSVEGAINGLTFTGDAPRTVMSGDPLKYESTLLPGFFMVIDGRTNNARFLQRNLKRNYKIQWLKERDVTTFELDESSLGPKNILGAEAYSK